MSEKIKVRWEPSASGGYEYFTPEDLECETMDEFLALEKYDQEVRIIRALDEADNRSMLCFAQLDKWEPHSR